MTCHLKRRNKTEGREFGKGPSREEEQAKGRGKKKQPNV